MLETSAFSSFTVVKLPAILSHRRSTTVSLETNPFIHYKSLALQVSSWNQLICTLGHFSFSLGSSTLAAWPVAQWLVLMSCFPVEMMTRHWSLTGKVPLMNLEHKWSLCFHICQRSVEGNLTLNHFTSIRMIRPESRESSAPCLRKSGDTLSTGIWLKISLAQHGIGFIGKLLSLGIFYNHFFFFYY